MRTSSTILPAMLAVSLAAAPGLAFGQARDGTPGNPPSDAVGRSIDRATGQPTIPDGQPGNPPGTAVGRAVDRATGQPTNPDGTGNNPPGTAADRALERAGSAAERTATPAPSATAPTPALAGEIAPSSRASRIIGSKVYNDQGESIGEVEDLVLQGEHVTMAVISVGGFLGIGAKLVAVPLSELRYATQDSRWTLHGATRDSLKARPEVTYASRG